jgi:Flp pilus assembly protein TadG
MRYQNGPIRRKGAVMVDNAIILLLLLMFIIGTIVGGLGVLRYQQIALLAREGARYASVRGTQFQADGKGAAATPTDVFDNAMLPLATGLDQQNLTYSVVWPNGKTAVYADPTSIPPGQPKGATVEVTVNYKWIPEAFFGGTTMTSKSVMPMQY